MIEVTADDVIGVRRAVLRDGRLDLDPGFPEDWQETTVHLAARGPDGEVVGVATFFPRPPSRLPPAPSPHEGRDGAWQLRGMAVVPSMQGAGVGSLLLAEGVRRVGARGGRLVWAHARDSALGFYQRQGWEVVGEGYVYGTMGLPHHTVVVEVG